MPSLGIGSALTRSSLTTPGIVTDNLVLKHKYDAGGVIPVSDGAVQFVGSDDKIAFSSDAISGSNGLSVGGWFYLSSSITERYATLFGKVEWTSSTRGFVIRRKDAAVQFTIGNGSSNEHTEVASYEADKWTHFYGTVSDDADGSKVVKFYINGALIDTETAGYYADAASRDMQIGYASLLDASTSDFIGFAANVNLYTVALEQPQIKSIMNKNYAGLTSSETDNLVSWWNLDIETDTDGTAGTGGVKDSHGTKHGTIS